LYQPFTSGCRAGVPVTVGGVESYLIVSDVEPVLPALSVQEPETVTFPPSGPLYVPDVQDATPDPPSSPVKLNETGFVYHPFESGPRAGPPVTPGGDPSFRTLTLLPTNEPP
jgi:hypothetical protein